jgi:hypothetical protein
MNATFQDLQDMHNTMNGICVHDEHSLNGLLDSLKGRQPFFFKLVAHNGFTLLIGLGPDVACLQYSASDGEPPYLMAIGDEVSDDEPFTTFLTGNTPTPVPRRFCMPIGRLKRLIEDFLRNGEWASGVVWEAI